MRTAQYLALVFILSLAFQVRGQGPLLPDAAPAPGLKTLGQVEPRIPITSVPMVISNAGSYYFTSNLLCNAVAVPALDVLADHVTIDLCGFTLEGTSGGNAAGILQTGKGLCVENGCIRNFDANAIYAAGMGNVFKNLRIDHCEYGIGTGPQALVDSCNIASISNALGNAVGIYCESGGIIRECAIRSVRGSSMGICRGIQAESDSLVVKCTVADVSIPDGPSSARGIYILGGAVTECMVESCQGTAVYGVRSVIRDCTTRWNVNGIYLTIASRAENCVAIENYTNGFLVGDDSVVSRCIANNNYLQGIHVDGSKNVIADNTCNNNLSSGIFVFHNDNRIEGNHVYANEYGIYLRYWAPADQALHNVVARNTVGKNTTENFHHVGDNYVAPLDTTGAFANPMANLSL